MTFLNILKKEIRTLIFDSTLASVGNLLRPRPADAEPPVFVSWSDGLGDVVDVEYLSSYTIANANFTDNKKGDFVVVSSATIDTSLLDEIYTIEYVAYDDSRNKTSKIRTYNITDTSAAEFVRWADGIVNDNVSIEINTSYTLPNAIFEENGVEFEIAPNVGQTFITSSYPASYIISYTATDSSGNSTIKQRTYKIIDSTLPTMAATFKGSSLTNNAVVNIQYGVDTEPTFTYSDNSEPLYSVQFTQDKTFDNTLNQTIVYTTTDVAGNSTTFTIQYITIDTIAPTFVSFSDDGADTVNVSINSSYTLPTANFTDLKKGDFIVQPTGTLNTSVLSSTVINYDAVDNDGNSTTKTRTYNIVDTQNPVITFTDSWVSGITEILTGSLPIANVSDNSDENITPVIIFDTEFNVDITGLYTYTYTATDSSGNYVTVTRQYQAYGPPTFDYSTYVQVTNYGIIAKLFLSNISIPSPVSSNDNQITVDGINKTTVVNEPTSNTQLDIYHHESDYYYKKAYTIRLTSSYTTKYKEITTNELSVYDSTTATTMNISFNGNSVPDTQPWVFDVERNIGTQGTITTSFGSLYYYTSTEPYTVDKTENFTLSDWTNFNNTIPTFDNSQNNVFYLYVANNGNDTSKTLTYNVFDSIVEQVTYKGQVVNIDNTLDVIQYTDNEPTFTVTNGSLTSQSTLFSNDILGARSIIYTFTHDTITTHTKQITINYNIVAQADTTAPVITATYNGVAVNNNDTLTVEKYTGVEALIDINEGTLSQDYTFSNTVSQTIIYTATDSANNSTSITIYYNVVDTTPPVITATFNGVSVSNNDTLTVEKYTGVEAVVVANEGTISQDFEFSNTIVERTITYTATDAYNSTNFIINYRVVDSTNPTLTYTKSTTDLTMTLNITSLSEPYCQLFLYKDETEIDTKSLSIATTHTFTITETTYGTKNYMLKIKDGLNNFTEYNFTQTFTDLINPTATVSHTTSYDYAVNYHKIDIVVSDVSEDNTTVEVYKLFLGNYTITSSNTLGAGRTITKSNYEYFGDGDTLTVSYKVIVKDPADNSSVYLFDATFDYVGLTDINLSFDELVLTVSDVGVGAYNHYHWNIEETDYMSSSITTHTLSAYSTEYTITAFAVNSSHTQIGNTITKTFTSPTAPTITAPTATIGTPTITDLSFSVDITGISEDNVEVGLRNSTGQLATSGNLLTTRTYTFTYAETAAGTYDYTIRLTDASGNTTDYAFSATFEAVSAPSITIINDLTSYYFDGQWYDAGYTLTYLASLSTSEILVYRLNISSAALDNITIQYVIASQVWEDLGSGNPTRITDTSTYGETTATGSNPQKVYCWENSLSLSVAFNNPYYEAPPVPEQQTISSTGGSWGVRTYDVLRVDGTVYVYSVSSNLPQHEFGYDYSTDSWVDVGNGDPKTFVISVSGNNRIIEGWRAPDSEFNATAGIADMIFSFTDPYYVAPPAPTGFRYLAFYGETGTENGWFNELSLTLSDGSKIDYNAPIQTGDITILASYYIPPNYQAASTIFDGVDLNTNWAADELLLAADLSQILAYFDAGNARDVVSGIYKTYNSGTDYSLYGINNGALYGANTIPTNPENKANWTLITTLTKQGVN